MQVHFGTRINRDYNQQLQSNWPVQWVLDNEAIKYLAKNTSDQVELKITRPHDATNEDKTKVVDFEIHTPTTTVAQKLSLEEIGGNIMQTIGMFATALVKAHNGQLKNGDDLWTTEGIQDNPAIQFLAQADNNVKLTTKASSKAPDDHVDFEIQTPTISAVKTASLKTIQNNGLKTVGQLATALAKAHAGQLGSGPFH